MCDGQREIQCPTWGYPTVGAYYRDASSSDSLLAVRIPLFAINAEDDPVRHIAEPEQMTVNGAYVRPADCGERSHSVRRVQAKPIHGAMHDVVRRSLGLVRAWWRKMVRKARE